MFIKIGEGFADSDLYYLQLYLALIDEQIETITTRIENSTDPDSDGLLDLGEDFIGRGFLGIQTYMIKTYPYGNVKKWDAFEEAPFIADGVALAYVINAAANYYKHMEEWGLENIVFRDVDALDKKARLTVEAIMLVCPWSDYTLSNLLAKMTPNGELSFSSLLPQIEEWRSNIANIEKL
jgi:hypothetical protein